MHPKFTVLVQFGTQYTARKPNVLPLGVSDNISLRPQKNHIILVKLKKKKKLFRPKLGQTCLLGQRQRIIRNSHIGYPSTLSSCEVLASGYLPFLTLPRRNNSFFWFENQLDPFCEVWGQ